MEVVFSNWWRMTIRFFRDFLHFFITIAYRKSTRELR
jgi:hypothetical protein